MHHKNKVLPDEEKKIKELAKILLRIYLNNPTYQQEEKAKKEALAKHLADPYVNKLKEYRKQKKLTQEQVSIILGFKSSNRIADWENGKTTPNLGNLMKLSVLYEVDISAIYPSLHQNMQAEIDEKKIATMYHPKKLEDRI